MEVVTIDPASVDSVVLGTIDPVSVALGSYVLCWSWPGLLVLCPWILWPWLKFQPFS